MLVTVTAGPGTTNDELASVIRRTGLDCLMSGGCVTIGLKMTCLSGPLWEAS
jgi:hypothetical protein